MESIRELRCRRCKKFYIYEDGFTPDYCPECTAIKDGHIKNLREIVRENRGICAMELEHMTGIPIGLIMELINKGEITVKKDEIN